MCLSVAPPMKVDGVLSANNLNLFVGDFGDLEVVARLLQRVLGNVKLLGYKLHNGEVRFGEVDDVSEVPTNVADVQRPGHYRLTPGYRFRHSFSSPKAFLLPPEHTILTTSPNYGVVEYDSSPECGVVFFGVKPCDRKAVEILDRVIYGKNPVYTKRRDAVRAIVIEECLEPGETCFCSAVNAGPTVSTGFDLAYARLHKDLYIFKYGSPLGERVLSRARLRRAEESHVKEYAEMVGKAVSTMNARVPNIRDVQKALNEEINDRRFWEEVTSKCVGCGNCNYVCPTCFCIEVEDVVEGDRSRRVGIWAGCRTYTYGLVAGGHFRRELYTRYRHFVLHKFLFYPKQVGDVGCVGCGRCSTWCPLGLDLKDVLKHLTEVKTR